MATPIHPLADNVVALVEEPKTKTAGGLYLPEAAAEKSKTAKVVAVGPHVVHVKVGDRILYKSFSMTDVKVGKDQYIIVREEDVLATVK